MRAFRDHAVRSSLRLAVLLGLLLPVGVSLLGVPEAGAQTLGPPSPATVREGIDFATFVLGQPWDMTAEPYPDFPTVLFGYNRPAATVASGGIWTITTNTADAGIRIHSPGIQLTQKVLRLGDRFPIDAGTYKLLSFQLCSTQGSAAQILWFTQADPQVAGSIGQTTGFTVFAGCRIYVTDLSQIPVFGAPWAGAIAGLRIDPTNNAADIVLSLDWIRLTSKDTANVVNIPWSGAGQNQVDFFLNRSCSLSGAMRIGRRNTSNGNFQWGAALQADPTQFLGTATPFPLPESFEPGAYTLFMQIGTGNPVGCQTLTIQKAPILTFFKPSFFSGPDYATEVRGNAWDMTDPGDIALAQNISSLNFANGEAVGVTNATGDPAFFLATPAPIDTSRYRYATFQYALEGFQDIGLGSVQRFFWWFSSINVDRVATRDMIIYEGYQTYTIDLSQALLEPAPSTLGPGWTGAPTVLRFDPDEFAQVKVFHLQYLTLTGDDRAAAGQDFPIRYTRSPGAPQPSFYFDPDNNPSNQNHFIISLSGASCPADPTAPGLNLFLGTECFMARTTGVPAGTYFIRGELNDGVNVLAARYSDVPVILEVPPAQASIDTPGNGANVTQPFTVAGWAVDPSASSGTGVDAVHVYAQPAGGGAPIFLGVASYGGARADIGGIFGAQFTNSGWGLVAGGLAPGTYQVQAYAHSQVTGAFTLRTALVTIVTGARMSIDTPGAGAVVLQPFTLAGWAIDLGGSSGTGVDAVHVYAQPIGGAPTFLGVASYGGARADIGGIFGPQFTNSGFGIVVYGLAPGSYQLLVFAHSSATGTFNNMTVVPIVVPDGARLSIDSPPPGTTIGSQPFLVAGWAIDLGVAPVFGTGVDAVHVYVIEVGGGGRVFGPLVAPYGGARADVGGIFGAQFTNSGYGILVNGIPSGSWQVQVFSRGINLNGFITGRLAPITIP